MTIHIRAATAEDAVRINRIHYSAVHGLAAEAHSPEQLAGWSRRGLPEPERMLAERLTRGDVVLIATLGRAGVGFAELSGTYVRAIYVRAKNARCGVGAALLAAVEYEAQRRGVEELNLESSINALPFYESHGYLCTRKTTHQFGNGTTIACAIMRKRIAGGDQP